MFGEILANEPGVADMRDDPIVAEVRKARQEIFDQCGRSLTELVKYLERRRKETGRKVVRLRRKRARAR